MPEIEMTEEEYDRLSGGAGDRVQVDKDEYDRLRSQRLAMAGSAEEVQRIAAEFPPGGRTESPAEWTPKELDRDERRTYHSEVERAGQEALAAGRDPGQAMAEVARRHGQVESH